jgi:hypothetical protein
MPHHLSLLKNNSKNLRKSPHPTSDSSSELTACNSSATSGRGANPAILRMSLMLQKRSSVSLSSSTSSCSIGSSSSHSFSSTAWPMMVYSTMKTSSPLPDSLSLLPVPQSHWSCLLKTASHVTWTHFVMGLSTRYALEPLSYPTKIILRPRSSSFFR